jgi:hypothetical protein
MRQQNVAHDEDQTIKRVYRPRLHLSPRAVPGRQALPAAERSSLSGGQPLIVVVLKNTSHAEVSAPANPMLSDLVAALVAEAQPGADERFHEWVQVWEEERRRVRAEHDAIVAQIEASVPKDRCYELVGKLTDLSNDASSLVDAMHRELVFRHLPGLAPTLRLLWMHALETRTDELEVCDPAYCASGDNGPC